MSAFYVCVLTLPTIVSLWGEKGNSKGPLPKWPPSCLFSHPLLTLAPQETASPSRQPSQSWCGGAATVSPTCLCFLNVTESVICSPEHLWMSKSEISAFSCYLQWNKNKLFLIMCNFRHYYCFVRPVIVVLNSFKKSSSVSVVISPLLPSVPQSSIGSFCHLTSLSSSSFLLPSNSLLQI